MTRMFIRVAIVISSDLTTCCSTFFASSPAPRLFDNCSSTTSSGLKFISVRPTPCQVALAIVELVRAHLLGHGALDQDTPASLSTSLSSSFDVLPSTQCSSLSLLVDNIVPSLFHSSHITVSGGRGDSRARSWTRWGDDSRGPRGARHDVRAPRDHTIPWS
jgi:hypothetical protein